MADTKFEQLWFVMPLGISPDPNKPAWGPELENPPARRPARAQRNLAIAAGDWGVAQAIGNELDAGQQAEPPQEMPQPITKGRGFYISAESRRKFEKAFTTQELAEEEAKERAQSNPKIPYGVFACIAILETTVPQVIEKKFNETGELVVK